MQIHFIFLCNNQNTQVYFCLYSHIYEFLNNQKKIADVFTNILFYLHIFYIIITAHKYIY